MPPISTHRSHVRAFALGTFLLASRATAQSAPASTAARSDTSAAPSTATASIAPSELDALAERKLDTPPLRARHGFTLEGSVSYGRSTEKVLRLELDPYATTLGVEPGYTFHGGLRLGARVEYSFGDTVAQSYQPVLGAPYDLEAQSSALHAGMTLGYDVPLYFLLMRYTLGIGFTRLSWDFDYQDRAVDRIPGYDSNHGSLFSFLVAPGLALVWPFERVECGLGFEYLVQSADRVPSGVLGRVLVGAKL